MNDPIKDQVIKLNIGCGDDFILNYRNIDMNPKSPHVERGDITNLDTLSVAANSVDEIRAVDCLQMIPLQMLQNTLRNWVHKLRKNGTIIIQSHDIQVVANKVAFEQITIQQANEIAYGTQERPNRSLITIGLIENILKELGMITVNKSLNESIFNIRAVKP